MSNNFTCSICGEMHPVCDHPPKDKPFPWHCTCGEEKIMPDGRWLTCRNCGEQWGNPYDQNDQFGASQSSDEYARMYCELHKKWFSLHAKHAALVEAAKAMVSFVDGLGRYEKQNIPMIRKHVEALRKCVESGE